MIGITGLHLNGKKKVRDLYKNRTDEMCVEKKYGLRET